MNDLSDQRVIIYDKGNKSGYVYDTAYDDKQVQKAIANCVNFHGRWSNVRAVAAKGHVSPAK